MDLQLPDDDGSTAYRCVTFDTVSFPAAVDDLFRYGAGWRRELCLADQGDMYLRFWLKRGVLRLEIETTRWFLVDTHTGRQAEQGEADTFPDVFAAGMAALNRHLGDTK